MHLWYSREVLSKANAKREKSQARGRLSRLARWLEPGLGVKRWLAFMILGTALVGLGLAIFLLDLYRTYPDSPWMALLSMRALPRWLRAVVLAGLGGAVLVWASLRLNQALLAPYRRPGRSLVEAVSRHRRLGKGPYIVTIGGGTGLSTLLRGLKEYSSNLTAIVSMADDGGSSGRLRRSLGLPPPGDIRACLAALSADEDLLTQLFQYRFREGEELGGHSFGNLFIAALAGVTGSFETGVLEAARVLGVQGQVLPSTASSVALLADKTLSAAGQAVRIEGESRIPAMPGKIRRIQLEPNDPPAYPPAIQAILAADMIVIGPGSLYTSLIPNLLVPDIARAIQASRAFKVYVCNVATQPGETDQLDCCQHLEAIQAHVGNSLVDLAVANDHLDLDLPEGCEPVQPALERAHLVPIYAADLVDLQRPTRHDARKLAETLIALLEERTGPLEAFSDGNGKNQAELANPDSQ
ncbi:MAG TPA: uridine diphosphate-N-acetylglucosamine-binding protein YvcK [Chloroflexi bacterium]|nr:uridine diphosphate-N-acetylglucosamine-binding protein YvcK [Chloroflexota bacterium]